MFNLHNPPRRFGTGVCVYVGRARGTFFKKGSKTTTRCAERHFSPRFGFDRENPARGKKIKNKSKLYINEYMRLRKYMPSVSNELSGFYLEKPVMMDNLKIIFAGIKVKEAYIHLGWSWLIDWILLDSLTLLLLKDKGRV